MKRLLQHSILFSLLAFAGLTACYQPIDLTPAEDPEIPWVHCILAPDSLQYVDLKYLDASGTGRCRPVEEAEVTLEISRLRDDGEGYFSNEAIPFERAGNGRWQASVRILQPLVFSEIRQNMGNYHFRLQVVLPAGDTLRAETTMPSGSVTPVFDANFNPFFTEFDLNGKHYSYPLTAFQKSFWSLYRHEETCRYQLPPYEAVWVYKVGVAEDGRTYIEDALANDHEEWTDPFNLTGQAFTSSSEAWAMSMYPDVAGQPLHFRYLHFPAGKRQALTESTGDDWPESDYHFQGEGIVAISGDFKGPHYGVVGPLLSLIFADQAYEKAKAQVEGIPYADNILTTRQVGYLQFLIVSTEYDKYLKDVAQAELLLESTDIVGIYDNTNIYSNIQGGTGIFGAQIPQLLNWSCGVWIFE